MNTEKIMEDIQSVQDNIREIKSTWGNTIMTLDNIKSGLKADVQKKVDEAYQRGLEDAWEAARRIVVDTDHGGLALGTLSEIFDTQSCSYIMRENTAPQAIDKIKNYEDKHTDRIEVGDEVRFLPNDRKGIVTACHVPDVYAENDKYAVFCGTTVEYVLRQHITKTGKHYDIASILEAMRK